MYCHTYYYESERRKNPCCKCECCRNNFCVHNPNYRTLTLTYECYGAKYENDIYSHNRGCKKEGDCF